MSSLRWWPSALDPSFLLCLWLSNCLLYSDLVFIYEDASVASDVVENVVYKRFYEISGKTRAVEWPGRKAGEPIFTVTHCVSSIVFSRFTHNTIISIKIYQVFTVFHWMEFMFMFIRAQGQHTGITRNTDCACCWKWHRKYGTASRKSECRGLSLIWQGRGTRSSSQLHIVEGKAHFHVLSGAALIGSYLISVEDDVKIDSLIACCVEKVEVGLLLFPEANFSWLAWDNHNTTFPRVEWYLSERVSRCFSPAESQLFPNKVNE